MRTERRRCFLAKMSNQEAGTSSDSLEERDPNDHVVPGTSNDNPSRTCRVDNSEEVYLEVEGTILKCSRSLLINNSDYFRVMLEGNFREKYQNTINLKDIDLEAMQMILQGLTRESYLYENEDPEDVLLLLQTSIMLQFNRIEKICVYILTEILELSNCIRIWVVTEQLSIKPLYLKAKLMALDEFLELKDLPDVLELTLEQIVSYLGSVYIKTDTEYTIFQTIMNWWKANCIRYSGNSFTVLLKLLSCIDFQELDDVYFLDILLDHNIANDREITDILKCLRIVKMGVSVDTLFKEEIKAKVKLLLNTTSRKTPGGLCILANTLNKYDLDFRINSMNTDSKQNLCPTNRSQEHIRKKRAIEASLFHPDKPNAAKPCAAQAHLARARPFHAHSLQAHLDHARLAQARLTSGLAVLFFDERYPAFRKAFDIENHRCFDLDGFAIMGYKQQVFVYGGQFIIGKGEWNYDFWVYDSIQEQFEDREPVPYPRRHFETCIVKNTIFICGGTGIFRIFQDNIFWYDSIEDIWSSQRPLPVPSDKQIKSCLYRDTLFVFSTLTGCGYFFREGEPEEWEEIKIELNTTFSNNFVIFSYKDKLYFKGKMLIECTMEDKKLVKTSHIEIADFDFCKIEVLLMNNIAYTYYEYSNQLALEWYNIDTGEKKFIFRDVLNTFEIETAEGEKYVLTKKMRIFTYHYYGLVEGNTLVNENF